MCPLVPGLALAGVCRLAGGRRAAWPWRATNAIAVLIITCPCALGLAVPAVQIVATGRLFQRGLFVKSGDALERLAEIDMAIFDKTGTLDDGRPGLKNARRHFARIFWSRPRTLARASRHPLAQALAAAAGAGPGGARRAGNRRRRDWKRRPMAIAGRLGSAAWCGRTP